MIPARFVPILSGFILSGLMSFVVSGISALRTTGLVPGFMDIWTGAWLAAWLVAFPVVLLAAPLVGRFMQRLARREPA